MSPTVESPPLHVEGVSEQYAGDKGNENQSRDSSINYAENVSQGQGASVGQDGRIYLGSDFKHTITNPPNDYAQSLKEFAVDEKEWKDCPKINIVIMIVGSRGDVQPYVALGRQLLKDGHRVRIATHETFRSFVNDAGLEFFSIGGNPQDLMSYMVRNPGLMPQFESLTNGDIVKKREMLNEMIDGCWNSCHSPCRVTGRSFAADTIISNPPAFAHIHCAEALGIPLLLSFTMPWSPTKAFAHPLVNIIKPNAGPGMSNYLSYAAAELLTWQGVGDIINNYRSTKLGLPSLGTTSGPGYVDRLRIPWAYCMSPALVPKPDDWKNHIDVTGFYFLDLATSYQPPPELVAFLSDGEAPVYIGFGSVVVDDPAELSETIFQATKEAGVRALVSSGWGGLGGVSVPSHIYVLGNVPHDWLFDHERVSAVVHHGGAGTTAIGLAKGCPTVVVPFFGDQAFWGSMIHEAGAGPEPIPHRELTVDKLRDAIKFAVSPAAKQAAKDLGQKIYEENGVHKGVESFYKHLPLLNMRCDLDPSHVAVWWSREQYLKLSAFAAQTLADAKLISLKNLVLHRSKDYKPRNEGIGILSGGGASAIYSSLTHQTKFGDILHSAVGKADGITDVVTSIHEGFQGNFKETENKPKMSPSHESMTGIIKESAPERKKGFFGAIKRLVTGSNKHSGADLTMNVQGPWKLAQTASGKTEYVRLRLARIAEGRKSVKLSTESQRTNVIERYNAEIRHTPTRKKLYSDAVERAKADDTEKSEPSSSDLSGTGKSFDALNKEDISFVK